MLISLPNLSNLLKMANFLVLADFGGHFCYTNTNHTVKVKIIQDFYTLTFVLINLQEEIGEKQFL